MDTQRQILPGAHFRSERRQDDRPAAAVRPGRPDHPCRGGGHDRLGQDRPVHRHAGRGRPAGHPGHDDRPQGRYDQPAAALPRPAARRISSPGSTPTWPAGPARPSSRPPPKPPQTWQKGLAEWGIGRRAHAGAEERGRVCRLHPRLGCRHPGQHPGLAESARASPGRATARSCARRSPARSPPCWGWSGLDDIDPVRSREHILLSNIFETRLEPGQGPGPGRADPADPDPALRTSWASSRSTPSSPRRTASSWPCCSTTSWPRPAFQTWIEGQPLDIPSLLYTPDGRPRHSVFYMAHLTDAERMFFVTLLLFGRRNLDARPERHAPACGPCSISTKSSATCRRSPTRPPSSRMLRMLKQARAFGVGLVLATQNPVDVDYKALSNAGTWFIGKLQTEQDKQRLLDGLEGALAGGHGPRPRIDRLISGLGKRVFLHAQRAQPAQPLLFQTRWAMNYLAGPLTRTQIPALERAGRAEPCRPPAAAPPQPARRLRRQPRRVPASQASPGSSRRSRPLRPAQPLRRPAAQPWALPPARPSRRVSPSISCPTT